MLLLHANDLIVKNGVGTVKLTIHKKKDIITGSSTEPCPELGAHKPLLILAMGLVAEIATLDLLDALGVLDGVRHAGEKNAKVVRKMIRYGVVSLNWYCNMFNQMYCV
jgi:hypothetical protein